MNIAIMGTGKSLLPVMESLLNKEFIVCFLDNNRDKIGKHLFGKKIISPNEIKLYQIDYIVTAIVSYEKALEQLQNNNIEPEKIINFYEEGIDYNQYINIFDILRWKELSFKNKMTVQLEAFIKHQEVIMRNIPYEIAFKMQQKQYLFPIVQSVEETTKKIVDGKMSISRYGDGEFEIIAGQAKDPYQSDNILLSKRLKEILVSSISRHIVAIADDYGSLDKYNANIQHEIRKYMKEDKRKFHYSILDMEKKYYNAYVSRPYSIYDYDKIEEAMVRFHKLQQIWQNQEIVFVEGNTTRMGVGNDLFYNVKSIERIIAPEKDAFDKYDDILRAAKNLDKNKLFIIALGPAATVLAYDLAQAGFWALDMGHLDIEYEWLLRGKGPTYVSHKYNNEVYGDEQTTEIRDDEYYKQIIAKV